MVAISNHFARDELVSSGEPPPGPSLMESPGHLIVVLIVLVVTIIVLIGLLYVFRRRRLARRRLEEICASLPPYSEKRASSSSSHSHRRVMTRPSESLHVFQEKQTLMREDTAPRDSLVPEIHITFPEETDAAGRKQSGRVVVVRMGENGEGMEPLVEDALPVYQEKTGERFQSLDLERIGGLVEKPRDAPTLPAAWRI